VPCGAARNCNARTASSVNEPYVFVTQTLIQIIFAMSSRGASDVVNYVIDLAANQRGQRVPAAVTLSSDAAQRGDES